MCLTNNTERNYIEKIHLRGQFCSLHDAVSKEFPMHVKSPLDREVLVQVLKRT